MAGGAVGRARFLLALVVLGAAACWLAVEALGGWSGLAGPGPVRSETAVVAAAATAGAAVAAWLALGATVSAAALLAGRRDPLPLVPAVVHRTTALLLGVALAAGTPAPADLDPAWAPTTATTTSTPAPAATATAAAATRTLDPGWRPLGAPAPPARTVAQPADPLLLALHRQPPDADAVVTVRRGDTLWDLAARSLGPGASDAEVAAEWPRWYDANREVVGPDPDLLVPGQQLRPPAR